MFPLFLHMKKSCPECRQAFEITKDDLACYEASSPVFGGKKEQIPPPTRCPDCRRQRRLAYRNERHLYHRKCDLTGKQIISNFAPDAVQPVYEQHAWFGDGWDPLAFGRDFDFSRPFFEQYKELQDAVPQPSLSVWHSENGDYCNYIGHVKSSYLIFGSVYSEDCYYGSPYYSKNCVDTLVVRECELCYECVDCRKLYGCSYCQDCHGSDGLTYCYDLQGCSDCIGSAGLRNKKFCVFNEQLTQEEFRKRKAELDLCVPQARDLLANRLQELSLKVPHRYMQSNQAEDVSGNYIYESQRAYDSYYADRSQDIAYCAQVVDLKNCRDNNYTEENEFCCDYLGAYQNGNLSFSKFCNQMHDGLYCDACHSSSDCFGCIGLRRKKYCILNKQYTKEEYEALVPKIIAHMRKDGEWGEFFPAGNSPFGYNETVAQEYFPMTQKEVTARDWRWRTEDASKDQYLCPDAKVSDDISKVPDDIIKQILICSVTGKTFRVIPQELAFYRQMRLPIPKKCPDQRHLERMAMRNPRKLWTRDCDKCGKNIRTTYGPDRPETVYCDDCYLKTVY